jgi:lipopolysaccharide export system permease protein
MIPLSLPVLPVYIARRALGPFAALTLILLFALTLERVLSLVQIVTELGAPLYTVGELVAYLLPHYLGLAIPAGWFLGVLIAVRGLLRDSELTVMRASGLSLRRLFIPVLLVSAGLGCVMVVITGYLQPYSRHAYRSTLEELKRKDFWSKLQPGVFTHLEGAESVIRVGAVADQGRKLIDLFASYQQPGERRVFVSAREALVSPQTNPGTDRDTQIDLIDGMMLTAGDRHAADAKDLTRFYFDVFPWNLSETGLLPPYGPRGQDEREMTLGELLATDAPTVPANDSPARRFTEWHSRLVECVSIPFLALLAAPLALLGRGRSSRAYGFVIGIALLVLYQKVLGTGESYGKLGHFPPGISVWAPCAGLAILAIILFHRLGGDRDLAPKTGAARRGETAQVPG